jgi:hypothetical protein
LFPEELTEYFEITGFTHLCFIQNKSEYYRIDFVEKNELPNGFSRDEYEAKDFMEPALIQDFPIRGRGVFLSIKKRRWRHKETRKTITRDFSFIADSSKFTSELSDFLKGTSEYAT